MIVISQKMLGEAFVNVCLQHAEQICFEKGYDQNLIASKLNATKNINEFISVMDEFFKNDLKISL